MPSERPRAEDGRRPPPRPSPLTPKPEPPPPPPLPSVAELDPGHALPQFAHKTAAVEFDGQVKSIVESDGEWSSLFPDLDLQAPADDARGGPPAPRPLRRPQHLRQVLDVQGSAGRAWCASSRTRCARRVAEPLDSASMELFYNDLYVMLTKRLHASLNGLFYPPTEAPPAPSLPSASPAPLAAEAAPRALADEMAAAGGGGPRRRVPQGARRDGQVRRGARGRRYAGFLDAHQRRAVGGGGVAGGRRARAHLRRRRRPRREGRVPVSRGDYENAEVFLKAHAGRGDGPGRWWGRHVVAADEPALRAHGPAGDQRTATKQARPLHGDDLGARTLPPPRSSCRSTRASLVSLALTAGGGERRRVGRLRCAAASSRSTQTRPPPCPRSPPAWSSRASPATAMKKSLSKDARAAVRRLRARARALCAAVPDRRWAKC